MKANKLFRVYGLLSLFITLLLVTASANAQMLASTTTSNTKEVVTPTTTLEKGSIYGDSLYVSRDGHLFKKGQNIQLGESKWINSFSTIFTSSTVFSPVRETLQSSFTGKDIFIEEIKMLKDGNAYLLFKIGKQKFSMNIERAILVKEVVL